MSTWPAATRVISRSRERTLGTTLILKDVCAYVAFIVLPNVLSTCSMEWYKIATRRFLAVYLYVIHRLGGPYWEKLCPRSWVPPEGTVSPNTDRPTPMNNIFIFFLPRFKSFRKIFPHSPTYVCWSRTRSCCWSARSIANQNETLQHDF